MQTRPRSRTPLLLLAGMSLLGAIDLDAAGTGQAPAPFDVAALQKEAVATLQAYVRIDTQVPPGITTKTADLLESILRREGLEVTRYESAPGKAIVMSRLEGAGAGKPLLLLHHMDVVPADAARWKVDPFSAQIVDGELWGRGAMDMKGTGVVHLYTFLLLKRLGIPLARDVIFLAVPDEEVGGGLGARWMIEHHYAELDPEYVLDEGGFGSPDLFSAGKLVFGIAVAEKKIVWIKVKAEGVAGHGSQPNDQNPNDRLTRALANLLSHPLPSGELELLEFMKQRIGPFAVNKFTNAIQHSTIALTTMRSGVGDPPKVNVIPSLAEATLDCRVLPGTSTAAWVAEIERRLNDPQVQVEVTYESDDPVVTPTDTPLYQALERAILRHHPGAVVSPILIPYGTDSNAFRPKGAKSYGVNPVPLPAEIVASMHGDSERVPIGGLGVAIQVFFEAIRDTVARR